MRGSAMVVGALALALAGCGSGGGGGGGGAGGGTGKPPPMAALPPIHEAQGSSGRDLAVVGLHQHPEQAGDNDLQLHFFAYNSGTAATQASTWRVYIDGSPFTGANGNGTINALAPGEWHSIAFPPRGYPGGTHTWTVIIDTGNENVENDENNNRVSVVVQPGVTTNPDTQEVLAPDRAVDVAGDPNLGNDLGILGIHHHPNPDFGESTPVRPDTLQLHWYIYNHSSDRRSSAGGTWQILVDGEPWNGINGSGRFSSIPGERWLSITTAPRDNPSAGVFVPTGTHTWSVRITPDGADNNPDNHTVVQSITVQMPVGNG